MQTQPVVDRVKPDYNGRVEFLVYSAVNSDQASGQFANEHGVTAIPTMMIVSADGTELGRHMGSIGEAELRAFVDKAFR